MLSDLSKQLKEEYGVILEQQIQEDTQMFCQN